MNSGLVWFVALVAMASAANLKEESEEQSKFCAAKFSIPADIWQQFETKPADIEVNENLKCFTKCVTDKSNLISKDNVFDVEKLAQIWAAHGRDESMVRTAYEKCKTMFKFDSTCDEAWAGFKCINGLEMN